VEKVGYEGRIRYVKAPALVGMNKGGEGDSLDRRELRGFSTREEEGQMVTPSEWRGQKLGLLDLQSGQSLGVCPQGPSGLQYPRSQDFISVLFKRVQKTRAKSDLAIKQFNFISGKKKKEKKSNFN